MSGPLEQLRAVNASAAWNRETGIEVIEAGDGRVVLRLATRPELTQYAGFLHAGVIGGLIDTACGFAAATVVGRVLASQFEARCLAPARGERFECTGRVLRAGARQVFAAADLHAFDGGETRLVATGSALLITVRDQ